MPSRVLHLVGSAVDEFLCVLSRLYAGDCLAAVRDDALYEMHIAYVTPDARWRFPEDLGDGAIAACAPMSIADAIEHLATLGIDVMVPQMFCLPGMTYYRGLFDLLGIPYVGNSPDVMALAAHKARAGAVVARAGVDVPLGELVLSGGTPTISPPAVVKPVDADNSLGVALVRDAAAYGDAVEAALVHTDQVLVERYVELGREVRCGVLVRDGELVCLPLEEYSTDGVRTYQDKISRGPDGTLALVAKQSPTAWIVERDDPITDVVWNAARSCHLSLGCRDYGLFDFRIDPGGRPWFLEAGLYCSFARQSVLSVMAQSIGIPTNELFATALEATLAR